MRGGLVRSILAGIALVGLAGATAPAPASRTLVLFGSRWCAPCMAEYAALAPLVEAAAPLRVALAWTDRPIVPPRALPPRLAGQVRSLDLAPARQLANRLGGEGYGLPMAAIIDGEGRVCALRRAAVGPAEVNAMRKRCQE